MEGSVAAHLRDIQTHEHIEFQIASVNSIVELLSGERELSRSKEKDFAGSP